MHCIVSVYIVDNDKNAVLILISLVLDVWAERSRSSEVVPVGIMCADSKILAQEVDESKSNSRRKGIDR